MLASECAVTADSMGHMGLEQRTEGEDPIILKVPIVCALDHMESQDWKEVLRGHLVQASSLYSIPDSDHVTYVESFHSVVGIAPMV